MISALLWPIFSIIACGQTTVDVSFDLPETEVSNNETTSSPDQEEDSAVSNDTAVENDDNTNTENGNSTDSEQDDQIPPTEMVSDFSLSDINPASSTYEQIISPRDHLGQITGWYLLDAT